MKRLIIYILPLLLLASCCETIHEYPDRDDATDVTIEVEFGVPPYVMYKEVTFDEDLNPVERKLPPTECAPYAVPDALRPCIVLEIRRATATRSAGELVARRRLFSERLWAEHRESVTERLPPGDYTLLCWGDYVPLRADPDDATDDEWLYDAHDLTHVETLTNRHPQNTHTMNAQSATVALHVPERATGRETLTLDSVPQYDDTVHIRLARTQGRLRLVADDLKQYLDKAPDGIKSLTVRVTYTMFVATAYNVEEQEPTNFISSYSYTTTALIGEGPEMELLTDYDFARCDRDVRVMLNLEFIAPDGSVVNRVEGLRIPVLVGRETVVRGPLLTADFQGEQQTPSEGISIDEGFEAEYAIVIRNVR